MLFTKTMIATDMDALSANLEQELRGHKDKYIIQSMVFIIGGVLAAVMPGATALNAELLIGAILLGTGILQLVLTVKSKMHWWSMLSSILSMAMGILIIGKPFAILLAFVTLMAIFMTLEGIFEVLLALEFRPLRNWRWMMLSGLITLTLATMLWIGFPAFDVLYLGWVIAANLLLYGFSLMMLVWKVAS